MPRSQMTPISVFSLFFNNMTDDTRISENLVCATTQAAAFSCYLKETRKLFWSDERLSLLLLSLTIFQERTASSFRKKSIRMAYMAECAACIAIKRQQPVNKQEAAPWTWVMLNWQCHAKTNQSHGLTSTYPPEVREYTSAPSLLPALGPTTISLQSGTGSGVVQNMYAGKSS